MLKRRISAFSLFEVALVLSILGVISAYAIPVLLQTRVTARWRETDAKIESVIYALASYVQMEQRLPYPADPAANGAGAGDEQLGRVTGIIPYRTLGIQASDVKDGFHHWISYSASLDLTVDLKSAPTHKALRSLAAGHRAIVADTASDQNNFFCQARSKMTRLDVQNIQGQSLFDLSRQNDFIAFVLVSHGPSGAGSFDDAGQRKFALGDKLKNLGNSSFVDRSISKEYDDRVRWVSRNNLMAIYAKQPCKTVN